MGFRVEAILIDLDDTLVLTGPVYREKVYEIIGLIGSAGLDVTCAHDLFQELEVEFIEKYGFKKERFPRSLSTLYVRLSIRQTGVHDKEFAQHIYDNVMEIYQHNHKVLDGAEQVLQALRFGGYHLILVTKGDEEVQLTKAKRAGLTRYFHDLTVVDDKTPDTWRQVAEQYSLDPTKCFVVGDSVRSDVNAAIAAGFNAIHVPSPHEWFFEKADPAPSALMKNHISELLDTFRVRHLVQPAWRYFNQPERDLKRAAADDLMKMSINHDVRKLMPDCPGLAYLFTREVDGTLMEVSAVFEAAYLDLGPSEEEEEESVAANEDGAVKKVRYEAPAGELSRAIRLWAPGALTSASYVQSMKMLPTQLCRACRFRSECRSKHIVGGIKAT